MYILTKIFINYLQYTYYNKFTFVSTFIKLLICILITISICLLSFPSKIEITDLDIALNKQNLLYLNLIFILSTYFLGLIKNIPGPEIIPYLNLPIKKNILLFFFLILSYFDFPFTILLLLPIFMIMFYSNFILINIKFWIITVIIHSFIFQQLGILTRIAVKRLIIKVFILFIIVFGSFYEFVGFKEGLLDTFFNTNLSIILSIILSALLLYYSKNQLFKNLINYV